MTHHPVADEGRLGLFQRRNDLPVIEIGAHAPHDIDGEHDLVKIAPPTDHFKDAGSPELHRQTHHDHHRTTRNRRHVAERFARMRFGEKRRQFAIAARAPMPSRKFRNQRDDLGRIFRSRGINVIG